MLAHVSRRLFSTKGAPVPVTVARGDGIGPEIFDATWRVLTAAGANLAPEEIKIGEKQYLSGHSSGIEPSAWESLRRTKLFFKAPITTPIGSGYKSLNVTIRKTLGLYSNVRPVQSYYPFVASKHPKMDVVIVRENEEDLYAGIEHRQTYDAFQCLKIITRPGCEKIVRYAFEYARTNGRKKVTCVVKDNIMKASDGIFYKVFEEIGKAEYPDIARERVIVDIGAALLADRPEKFDVMVMPNLYGDILSDIAAQISGSVGLGASANIGDNIAMFEAIHGSAPDIAGKNMANPSGLLLAGVQMLTHVKQPEVAETVYNAWAKTIEDGVHTTDIYNPDNALAPSTQKVGTKEFADAIVARLGAKPSKIKPASFSSPAAAKDAPAGTHKYVAPKEKKILNGVDIFVHHPTSVKPEQLAARLEAAAAKAGAAASGLKLQLITNRGVKVYPDGFPETFVVDHWRCRFRPGKEVKPVSYDAVLALMQAVHGEGLDIIKTENLCFFEDTATGKVEAGFSMGQGE